MKILQIIPAPEWMRIGIIVKDDPKESWSERVACLALGIDEDGNTRVFPVSAADCSGEFDGIYDIELDPSLIRVFDALDSPPLPRELGEK